MIREDTLIFDIETKTFGKPNPNRDELRFIGLYEMQEKKYHFYSYKEMDKIKKYLDNNGLW